MHQCGGTVPIRQVLFLENGSDFGSQFSYYNSTPEYFVLRTTAEQQHQLAVRLD